MPDFQIRQKKLKKMPSYYIDTKPGTLNKTITFQERNALKGTLNDILSTKTSNGRQEEEWLNP